MVGVVKVGSVIENSAKGSLLYPTEEVKLLLSHRATKTPRFLTSIEKTLLLKHLQVVAILHLLHSCLLVHRDSLHSHQENFVMTVLNPGSSTKVATGDVIYLTADNIITENQTDAASGLNAGSAKSIFQENSSALHRNHSQH